MRKYHLIVQIALFFILGIILEFNLNYGLKFLCLLVLFALIVLIYRNVSSVAAISFFLLLGLGVSHFQINEFKNNPFLRVAGQETTAEGFINSDVIKKDKYYFFTLKVQTLNSNKVNNLVKVYSKYGDVSFGDYIKLNANVKVSEFIKAHNPDILVFANSRLTLQGKHAFWSSLGKFRQWIISSILIEKNDASAFTLAMITGRISDLSFTAKADLQASGLSHLWSVSGLHTGFLAVAILLFLRLFSLRAGWQLIIIVIVMILFCAFTGFSSPVIRASIMACWIAFAYLFGRLNNWLPAVAAAAVISLSLNPSALFDPSFQLSYAAIISIFYFKEKVKSLIGDIPTKYKEAVSVGISAQIIPLPIIIFYFGQMPLFSLIANLVAIPIAAIVFNFTIIALLFKAIGVSFLVYVPTFLSYFIIKIASFLNSFELSTIEINNPTFILLIFICAFILLFIKKLKWHIKLIHIVILFLVIFTVSIWMPVTSDVVNANKVIVEYLDVGQGDSILINGPKNEKVLIDSGADQYTIMKHLSKRKINRLNLIIATHADSDHIGGLPLVLNSIKVDLIVDNGFKSEGYIYRNFINVIKKNKIKHFAVRKGQIINVGTLKFRILGPKIGFISGTESDDNNNSVVAKLIFYKHSFLFTGDAGLEEEKVFNKLNILSEVLKVAHHGSASSTSANFLKLVNARYAIISAGKHNMYGHPKPILLQRLKSAHVKIYRTDLSSTIKVVASKENLRIYE